MSSVTKQAFRNVKFTILAQVIVFILGLVKSVIFPKYMTVSSFGYWQIYVLYSTYIGLSYLVFNDGIYLLYGDYDYNELPKNKISASIKIYMLQLLIISFTTIGLIMCFVNSPNKAFALIATAITIPIMGIYGVLIYVLQITNQIKKYSFFSIVDKVIMLVLCFFLLFFSNAKFEYIIFSDVISKIIVVCIMCYDCKELIFNTYFDFKIAFKEYKNNIFVGFSLMLSGLTGMLVTGIGRFFVESLGNISDYAYYSFGISITNIVLIMIVAISYVLYPTLKRCEESEYPSIFVYIDRFLYIFEFIMLISYFVIYIFVIVYISNYTPVLEYLNLLFIVIFLQGKMTLLNNTFYKILRKEKKLLKENVLCIIVFILFSLISFGSTHNIKAIALSTAVAMLYRCYFSELYLSKLLNIEYKRQILNEIIFLFVFYIISEFSIISIGFFMYTILVIVMCLNNKVFIKSVVKKFIR